MCNCAIIICTPANAGDKCYKWCCGVKQTVVAAVYVAVSGGGGGGTSLEALLALIEQIDQAILDDGINVQAILDTSRKLYESDVAPASLAVTEWLVGDILPQVSLAQANEFLVPTLELQSSIYEAMNIPGLALQTRGMAALISRNMDSMTPPSQALE
jgi:hypothetical protein